MVILKPKIISSIANTEEMLKIKISTEEMFSLD